MESLIPLLQMGIFIILGIMVGLVLFYIYLMRPNTSKKKDSSDEEILSEENAQKKKIENYGRFTGELSRESILDFMEFDEIVDNMIVRKNGEQYVMILQCNGVNYDLMSEQEKISVEEG